MRLKAEAAPTDGATPPAPPPRGLRMEDLHQLVGELYLEITWLRKEVARLTAERDDAPSVG